jgi:hypothetical protein
VATLPVFATHRFGAKVGVLLFPVCGVFPPRHSLSSLALLSSQPVQLPEGWQIVIALLYDYDAAAGGIGN